MAFIEENTNYYAGGFMGILRVKNECLSKYLFFLLNNNYRQTIRDIGTGSNINNLSGIINEIKIPLPPLEIQEKIVKEIEDLENKEEKLSLQIDKLEKNIFSKIKNAKQQESKKIGEIFSLVQAGKRPKGGVGGYDFGIPSLGGEHIGLNGRINIENLKFVPKEFFEKTEQGILKDLDILICKDGALTGKAALFRSLDLPYDKAMINEHVFILRTNSEITQRFLFYIFFAEDGKNLLKEAITGQAQGGLNRENLLNIKLSIPSLPEQQKIVTEIEEIENQISKLNEELELLKKEKSQVLTKYL